MKQKTTTSIRRLSQWFTFVVAVTLIGQSAFAAVPPPVTLYQNNTTRETDGTNSLFFAQSGYEYGDEVVMYTNISAVLTNFKLEYYALGVNAGAQMKLRIYANDGDLYGTNFSRPGTLLYNGDSFDIVDGTNDGFGTYDFNAGNAPGTPGFPVTVPPSFTWTVEFSNITSGVAGLALYNPPTVGGNYDQFWEASEGGTNGWVYRKPVGFDAANFGAIATGTLTAQVNITVVNGGDAGSYTISGLVNGANTVPAGKPIKVTVTPTPANYYYSNSILVTASGGTTLFPGDPLKATVGKFILTPAENSTLTINCVTNRFYAVAGEYNGLFQAGSGVSQNSSGLSTIKVTAKKTFSGKAIFAGENFGFAGAFGLDGVGYTKKVMYSKKQVPFTNSVYLTLNFDGTISGVISNDVTHVVSTMTAKQYSWGPSNPANDYAGNYTMLLSSNTSASAPNGYSIASVTIDTNGIINMKGQSADGQKPKQKAKLSPDGEWPLFVQYAKNDSKLMVGSMYGNLQLSTNGTERASGTNTWIRNVWVSSKAPTTYTAGFTNVSGVKLQKFVCNLDPFSNKYTNAVINLPGLTGTIKLSGTTATNVPVVEFTNATMTAALPIPSKISPYGVKVTLNGKDGNVKGKFANPSNGDTVTLFYGIAMQGDQAAYGYWLAPTSTETVEISNP